MTSEAAPSARTLAKAQAPATAELRIAGLDCPSCVVDIEAGLGRLGSVEVLGVDWEAGAARVRYDPARTSLSEIEERIEQLGFSVREQGMGQSRPLLPPRLVLAAVALVLPLLVLVRDEAAYMPNALYVPGGLEAGRFDDISLLPIGLAFLLGVLIFFSPTILAMSSVVVGYAASSRGHSRFRAVKTAAGFTLGIVIVNAIVGAAFAAGGREVIRFTTDKLAAWNLLVGLTLSGTGLLLLRVWRLKLPTFAPKAREAQGFIGALFVGAPFGLLDCPGCTPLLLPVALGAAATGQPLYGAAVLGAYGLGRGVLLMGLGASTGFANKVRGFRRHLPLVEAASGAALLLAGLYFVKEFFRLASVVGL